MCFCITTNMGNFFCFSCVTTVVNDAERGAVSLWQVSFLLIPLHMSMIRIYVYVASCAGVTCSVGKSCVVDQLGLPHCLSNDCPFNSADRSPVCGADGHTYTGLCRLHEATCRVGRSVRLAYSGHCRGIHCYRNSVRLSVRPPVTL